MSDESPEAVHFILHPSSFVLIPLPSRKAVQRRDELRTHPFTIHVDGVKMVYGWSP